MTTQSFLKQYLEISKKIERLQNTVNIRKERILKLKPILSEALKQFISIEYAYKYYKSDYEKKLKDFDHNETQIEKAQVVINDLQQIVIKIETAVNFENNVFFLNLIILLKFI